MPDATGLLHALAQGDPAAADTLLPILYEELRLLAAAKLAREKPGQTLQPTSLVHEAYLRLINDKNLPRWESRKHFFGAAAEAMRRILVENARRKKALKHAHGAIPCDDATMAIEGPSGDILAVHDALDQLAAVDAVAAELVKLHFFVGFTMEETADVLGLSVRTAGRTWAFARTWLFRELSAE